MALIDSVGYGQGLQSQIKDYAGIYERGLAVQRAQQAAKAKKEDDDWKKLLEYIKPDPNLHPALRREDMEDAAQTYKRMQNAMMTSPNSYRNKWAEEKINYDSRKALRSDVSKNYYDVQTAAVAHGDPYQQEAASLMQNAKSKEDLYERLAKTKAVQAGTISIGDQENYTVGFGGVNPQVNLTDVAQKLLNTDDLQTQVRTSRQRGVDGNYIDKEIRTMPEPVAIQALGLQFDNDKNVQEAYRRKVIYSDQPEKLQDLRANYIKDYLPLRGSKVNVSQKNVPEGSNIDFGSQSESGKVNYAVSEKKGDEILGSHRPDTKIKTGAKIRTDDVFTVVDFARNDATKNKPIILDDENGKPVIVIPRRMIKNNRTGTIHIDGIKTEKVEGWEQVVGEPVGEIISIPYDRNKEALAVETDKLTWDYAMKHGKKDEVQTKPSSGKWLKYKRQ